VRRKSTVVFMFGGYLPSSDSCLCFCLDAKEECETANANLYLAAFEEFKIVLCHK
jgi:hypothetical protein